MIEVRCIRCWIRCVLHACKVKRGLYSAASGALAAVTLGTAAAPCWLVWAGFPDWPHRCLGVTGCHHWPRVGERSVFLHVKCIILNIVRSHVHFAIDWRAPVLASWWGKCFIEGSSSYFPIRPCEKLCQSWAISGNNVNLELMCMCSLRILSWHDCLISLSIENSSHSVFCLLTSFPFFTS